MRTSLFLALTLFVTLGVLRDARSDTIPFDVDTAYSSLLYTDDLYASGGCPAIVADFSDHPVPLGAIDVSNGREIVGWEIICDDHLVLLEGNTAPAGEDERDVQRSFGTIRLHYQPQTQTK